MLRYFSFFQIDNETVQCTSHVVYIFEPQANCFQVDRSPEMCNASTFGSIHANPYPLEVGFSSKLFQSVANEPCFNYAKNFIIFKALHTATAFNVLDCPYPRLRINQ